MSEEKQIEAKIYSHFKKDGKLCVDEDRVEILGAIRTQENVQYCTVSTDRKFSLPYGEKGASVFVSIPCILNAEEMEKAYEFAAAFCEKKLKEMGAP